MCTSQNSLFKWAHWWWISLLWRWTGLKEVAKDSSESGKQGKVGIYQMYSILLVLFPVLRPSHPLRKAFMCDPDLPIGIGLWSQTQLKSSFSETTPFSPLTTKTLSWAQLPQRSPRLGTEQGWGWGWADRAQEHHMMSGKAESCASWTPGLIKLCPRAQIEVCTLSCPHTPDWSVLSPVLTPHTPDWSVYALLSSHTRLSCGLLSPLFYP